MFRFHGPLMIYFHAFGDRSVPAKLDRSFLVGLSKEQAWFLHCIVLCEVCVCDCSWNLFGGGCL